MSWEGSPGTETRSSIVESVFANLSNHSTGEEPTVRETSNPVFRSLPKTQGGYAQFGTGAAGYGAQAVHADPYAGAYPEQRQAGVARPLTIDDVVTKTGITLGVLAAVAVAAYFLVAQNIGLAMPLMMVGLIAGMVLLLIGIFGRKQDNPGIVLS